MFRDFALDVVEAYSSVVRGTSAEEIEAHQSAKTEEDVRVSSADWPLKLGVALVASVWLMSVVADFLSKSWLEARFASFMTGIGELAYHVPGAIVGFVLAIFGF